jgi:hypothetical protein
MDAVAWTNRSRDPNGVVATHHDDGSIFVWPVSADLDPDGELIRHWRSGGVR